MKIYSCAEHIDVALDEYVDECELPPAMEKIESELSTTCAYCSERATYVVGE